MDAQIVKDFILDIINAKIEVIKARGVFSASYDELLLRLGRMGYNEDEVRAAIIKLVKNKEIKTGKFADGTGWLRDYRNIDKQEEA
jgi:hypothetical protein